MFSSISEARHASAGGSVRGARVARSSLSSDVINLQQLQRIAHAQETVVRSLSRRHASSTCWSQLARLQHVRVERVRIEREQQQARHACAEEQQRRQRPRAAIQKQATRSRHSQRKQAMTSARSHVNQLTEPCAPRLRIRQKSQEMRLVSPNAARYM